MVSIEAAGASLNELNETNAARAALAPFETAGVWTGGIADNINRSIMFEKQDLPNQQPLDTTVWPSSSQATGLGSVAHQLGVFGEKEIVKMKGASHANTTVLARFDSDKSPSIMSTTHGHGQLVFALFHPVSCCLCTLVIELIMAVNRVLPTSRNLLRSSDACGLRTAMLITRCEWRPSLPTPLYALLQRHGFPAALTCTKLAADPRTFRSPHAS